MGKGEETGPPASLPIQPPEQQPGSELGSLWERCDKVMGEGSITRKQQTLVSSAQRCQSCDNQLVHNILMICIFYTVLMRHLHMAMPTAGKTGKRV